MIGLKFNFLMPYGSVNDNGVFNDSTLLLVHHMLTLVLRRNVHPQTTTLAMIDDHSNKIITMILIRSFKLSLIFQSQLCDATDSD